MEANNERNADFWTGWIHFPGFSSPCLNEAIPNRDEYWKAMCPEQSTLTNQKNVLDVAQREQTLYPAPGISSVSIIQMDWSRSSRHISESEVTSRGKVEFLTFEQVINWTIVRLFLILYMTLDLAKRQVNPNFDKLARLELPQSFWRTWQSTKARKVYFGLKQSTQKLLEAFESLVKKTGFKSSEMNTIYFWHIDLHF